MPDTVVDWDKLEPRTVIPGFHGRFAHSHTMTYVMWQIDAGAVLPLHSHPHEQVVHQFEGRMELTIDGVTHLVTPGMMAVIPPHAPHSALALTACRTMDVFYPLREDYMGTGAPSLLQAAMK
ncbi:cupin [Labrys miyagiensis]